MNNEKGYIKIYRSILDWEWWSDNNVCKLFLYILLSANWKDKRWQGIEVKRGEFVTSIDNLASGTNLTKSQVRTSLTKLQSSGEVIAKSQQGKRYTIIRVCKFEEYQDSNEIANLSQTFSNEIATTKERKKEKKEKKDKKYYESDALNQTFIDYVDMRKRIKAPMTDKAVKLAMNKLEKLSQGDDDKAIKILEQSIMNSWKGLFELKEEKKTNKFNNFEGRQYSNDQLEKMLGVNK
jgi:hypothetical protein